MNKPFHTILLHILLPLLLITMACSLFFPEEPESTSKTEERPTRTPRSSATMDLSLLSSPPPMDEEPIAEVPVTKAPNTPTSTNTPVPTATQTPLPSLTPTATKAPAFSWVSEVVQASQASGYFANLKIDSQNNLHVGYFQDNYDMVWWMHTLDNKWRTPEQISGGYGRGFHISMVLDSNDNPHFAFHSYPTGNQVPYLYYKFWNGKAWMGLFKNSEYKAHNTDISLALGPDDAPHFVFIDNYAYNLIYARFSGNGFINQVVGRANPDCQSLPLVVDINGTPHIAYQSPDEGFVYATLKGEYWTWEVIDGKFGAGWYSDMALDNAGNIHVVYYDLNEKNLKLASRSEEGWQIDIIDSQGDVGQYPSMAVDLLGGIHVSYYDVSNSALKYASGEAGQWAVVIVDNLGNVGKFSSITIDLNNMPYIAYFDEDNEDLKLARSIPVKP